MDLTEAQLTDYQVTGRHPWELARIEVVVQLLKEHIPTITTQKITILDVGCGDTYLIEQLSKKLPLTSFVAVDTAFTEEMLEEYSARFTKANIPIRVFQSLDSAAASLPAPADVVLLLDVIEHISDDVSFLRYLQSSPCITADTRFFITVPAFQSLFCAHDVFLKHYRRYTNDSLQQAVTKSNLRVVEKGYFFSSLLLPRFIQVLLEKKTKPDSAKGIGAWEENPVKDNLIKGVLLLDFKITYLIKKLGITIPGLSNFIVCKKAE
ncbi:Methyltransferase type 12 [Hymenobacter roseosalivarius DSM 11622]|uniref:Methyltransferase type 12 n=1 Tax=Hymenobacter roseosalivarius DSM 11622 TaxID=645990 RepID=A0A1W1W1B7_9BACT|nr:class I SAM-dependent methyltransferase [Hymenobacter roseosalivarius]SMB99417.1 Methyltransferase type 12 [Hymenobacter roseosalivarius DSM 11622]